jgi:ethanolamine utilization protein
MAEVKKMDRTELIDRITAEVKRHLAESSGMDAVSTDNCGDGSGAKPKLLILNAGHCDICHLSDAFGGYKCHCALAGGVISADGFDAVAVYSLSIADLCKWRHGILDTPFTQMAGEALLRGVKIVVDKNGVELLNCQKKNAYYDVLYDNIAKLCECGVIFTDNIGAALADQKIHNAKTHSSCPLNIDKKLVTEKDIKGIYKEGVTEIKIARKAIVTMLARDFAHERGVKLTLIE